MLDVLQALELESHVLFDVFVENEKALLSW